MKKRKIFQIAILANDVGKDGNTLGEGTKARCDCALAQIRTWLCQTPEVGPAQTVVIYIATGKGGRWRGATTFAAAMAEYLRTNLGNEAARCGFVINEGEVQIWSTWSELKWIFSASEDQTTPFPCLMVYEPVRFVTNQIHSRRVRCIKEHFLPEYSMGEFVFSNEAPPHRLHEMCAYIKLALYYFGLGPLLEPLRRQFYNG
ncbi:MAG TPA: hypothetical protein PKD95_00460 [Candidatus Paceibacterota bacterium]|nr:hypothetical protein [Candidatus Paceibacterota bacterium]